MKNTFLLLFLMTCLNSFAQELPADSIILKKVFGETDKGGITYSRPFDKERNEGICTYEECIVWKIAFKQQVYLQNKNLLLVIIEADDLTQHGHQFGYRDIYFFKQTNNKLELIDSIITDQENPLGDNREFEIIDIGKNRIALVDRFASTGNQHAEDNKGIYLLEIGKLTFLLSVNCYSNEAWKITDSEDDECEASAYDEKYEIIKNEKEWYDIIIHHTDYGFTKGCKEKYIKFQKDKVFSYTDGKYYEKINN